MRLIIARHGQTKANVEGIIQGQLPGELTQLGIEQAKKLGLRMKDKKIDYIFCSDLKRAIDTLKEIKVYHKDVPVEYVTDIRECYHGKFQGMKEKDVIGQYDPEEETREQLFKRVKHFIEHIMERYYGKTVLLVSHEETIKAMITYLDGKTYTNIDDVEPLKNTSIQVYDLKEDRNHHVILKNCAKHLEE
jgi:probable phosphoglycerate mutase